MGGQQLQTSAPFIIEKKREAILKGESSQSKGYNVSWISEAATNKVYLLLFCL